jgi:hypothetical protein
MRDKTRASAAALPEMCAATARFGGLPELFTFECSACGVSHTEAS